MYRCKSCGYVFPYPDCHREVYPYGDGSATEEFGVCPACESGDFDPVILCRDCGNYLNDDDAMYNICPECEKEADAALVEFWDSLSDSQKEYLSEHRLGGWLKDAIHDINNGGKENDAVRN